MATQYQCFSANILLIEDNRNNAGIVLGLLKEACTNFQVQHCIDLESATPYLNKPGISIVLLDLDLPDSEGIETLIRVQALAIDIPIVVFTEKDDEEHALEVVQHGAQDYLVKGEIDQKRLISCTKYAMKRKQTELRFREEFTQKAEQILDPARFREFNDNMGWLEQRFGKRGA